LPGIIAKGPPDDVSGNHVWFNAVNLAGELKIKEACEALAKWMDTESGPLDGTIDLGIEIRLEDKPAAKALAEIGDPALPVVAPVLNQGDDEHRWDAVYILNLIGSPAAKKLLRGHVSSEPNPRLRQLIQRILEAK
jgi:HEAT repeat protein